MVFPFEANDIFFALLGGILPALLWLWFWLKEDRLHPEPRSRVLETFILGMLATIVVLPLQQRIDNFSISASWIIILWAATEEIFKYVAAYIGAIRTKECDEPIDCVIYLITAALGFSALENALFILSSLTEGNILATIATGNMRFIGATLLHVLSSAVIGMFIGSAFYLGKISRFMLTIAGLFVAINLHAAFNLFIIDNSNNTFIVFCSVWVLIMLLLVAFEKIKRLEKPGVKQS